MIIYSYPQDGGYADTVATLADGRVFWINTQYSSVLTRHADGCEKGSCSKSMSNICDEGQRRHNAACTCGALDGVDTAALVVDARANGKFGYAPKPQKAEKELVINPAYAHMSREEIKAAERRHDDIYNEGGEGYNPYRDNLWSESK